MVLPITTKSPKHSYLKTRKENAWYERTWFYDSIGTRYSQSQPWDRPLPYHRQSVMEMRASRLPGAPEIPDVDFLKPTSAVYAHQLAYERAYNKLASATRANGKSELGITLAQANLTRKLLEDYVKKFVYMEKLGSICATLDRFAFFIRKAALAKSRRKRHAFRRKAARVLGTRPTTDREVRRKLDGQLARTGVTSFSAEYLAFHYGWSPLFTEIYQLLRFLSEGIDLPMGFYQESGSSYVNATDSAGSLRARCVTKLGAVAQVTDELSYCLGVLGLANPAVVIWDVMKWSFVADWVLSIGPRLQAQSDFIGISFSNSYRTDYYEFEGYRKGGPKNAFYNQWLTGFEIKRQTGVSFTPPPIRVKNPISASWRKAFAQVSLLALFGLRPTRS